MKRHARPTLLGLTLAAMGVAVFAGQAPDREAYLKRSKEFSAQMEGRGLAEPFKGVTANGTVVRNLFEIRSTGVSTDPARTAAA